MISMDFDIPSGAERILQLLTGAGYEAYFVGGCVRDLLRGVPPHDWDICTSAHPEETAACFNGHHVFKTGLKHGTVTVLMDGEPYEITPTAQRVPIRTAAVRILCALSPIYRRTWPGGISP